jgi:hypothetical protein
MNDKMSKGKSLIPVEGIERSILLIRGHKVILDADLGALYGVETKQLRIPIQTGHLFRSNPASHSEANRPPSN